MPVYLNEWRLLTVIAVQLEATRSTLVKLVGNIMLQVMQCPCPMVNNPCPDAVRWSQEVAAEICDQSLSLQPFEQSVGTICTKARQMRIPCSSSDLGRRKHYLTVHRGGISDSGFKSMVGEIMEKGGICLDCVRAEGKTRKEMRSCRVPHS